VPVMACGTRTSARTGYGWISTAVRGHADCRLIVDGRWLDGVVSGRTRWAELLLSLRFTARRQPDRYNDYLVGLLKHADRAALRAVEQFEAARDPQETIEITAGDERVRVSSTCCQRATRRRRIRRTSEQGVQQIWSSVADTTSRR
jgi:hypothetical protein